MRSRNLLFRTTATILLTLILSASIVAAANSLQQPESPSITSDQGAAIVEDFEQAPTSWQITRNTAGSSVSLQQSTTLAVSGTASARAFTTNTNDQAWLSVSYSDPTTSHLWGERPGNWRWQQTSIYLPATTVANLGTSGYLTLAGFFPSAGGSYGWYCVYAREVSSTLMAIQPMGMRLKSSYMGLFLSIVGLK